jgi:hypothetical protein
MVGLRWTHPAFYTRVGRQARLTLKWMVEGVAGNVRGIIQVAAKDLHGAPDSMKRSLSIRRVLAVTMAAIVVLGAIAWHKGFLQPFGLYRPSNSLMIIMPYRFSGTWVFDDAAVGLRKEPFVAGIPAMIDDMVKDIPNAGIGFRLLFSTQPFPGYTDKLIWRRGDNTGNWYYSDRYDKEGWLCPGLFKYYREAPKEIYLQAEAK